jgi:hypothetical protein
MATTAWVRRSRRRHSAINWLHTARIAAPLSNRDKNYTVAKLIGRAEQVDASIARYLRALDQADREESNIAEAKSVRLKEKIAGLRRQMQALKAMEQTVQDAPDQQVSLTDPDARSTAICTL